MAETTSSRGLRPTMPLHLPFYPNGKPFSIPFKFERPNEPQVAARETALLQSKMGEILVVQGFRRGSAELASATDRILGQLSKNERTLVFAGMTLPPGVMALVEEEKKKAAIAASKPVNEFSAEAAHREARGKDQSNGLERYEKAKMSGGHASLLGGLNELRAASSPQSMATQEAQMRLWAKEFEVPWLANMSGTTSLTREQVKAFADAHVSREMFKSLQDRTFSATQNAAVAKYAADRKMSPEESKDLYHTIDKAADAYVAGSKDPKAAEDFAKLHTDIMTATPDKLPEANRRMNEALKEAEKNNPEGVKDFDAYRRKFDIKKQEEGATLEKRADQAQQTAEKNDRADAKAVDRKNNTDFFNDDAPSAPSEAPKASDQPAQKAEAAKPTEPEKPKPATRVASAPAAPKV